jgi:hypothetical protein
MDDQFVHCKVERPSLMEGHPTSCTFGKWQMLTNCSNRRCSASATAQAPWMRLVLQALLLPQAAVAVAVSSDAASKQVSLLDMTTNNVS